jgi:purine-nucleoside phosphorylase
MPVASSAAGLAGRPVVALAGRFHMYEGHSATLAGFPARVLARAWRANAVRLHAAGVFRATFTPGDLMLITDHLNLMFRNPLVGTLEPGDTRFPDMSEPYDRRSAPSCVAKPPSSAFPLREGVYCGLLGPTYETPAEVRMLATLAPTRWECRRCRRSSSGERIGMRVAGVSCITNFASGTTRTAVARRGAGNDGARRHAVRIARRAVRHGPLTSSAPADGRVCPGSLTL